MLVYKVISSAVIVSCAGSVHDPCSHAAAVIVPRVQRRAAAHVGLGPCSRNDLRQVNEARDIVRVSLLQATRGGQRRLPVYKKHVKMPQHRRPHVIKCEANGTSCRRPCQGWHDDGVRSLREVRQLWLLQVGWRRQASNARCGWCGCNRRTGSLSPGVCARLPPPPPRQAGSTCVSSRSSSASDRLVIMRKTSPQNLLFIIIIGCCNRSACCFSCGQE